MRTLVLTLSLWASGCAAALPAIAQAPLPPSVARGAAVLGLSKILTFFFLMLGPLQLIMPFAEYTRDTDPSFQRSLAVRAFLVSVFALVVAATLGVSTLEEWNLSITALTIAGGVVLFLVALQLILRQYSPSVTTQKPTGPPSLSWAVYPITFPHIVSPYGVAILIIVVAVAPSVARQLQILGVLMGVMVLDLLAMMFAQQILRLIGTTVLQIVGTVLAVLQVALGIDLIILGLADLGIAVRRGM